MRRAMIVVAMLPALFALADSGLAQPRTAADPPSKDALFGEDAPAEESRGARWSGFIDGLGAYTYADPTHWSRGVGRLQLVGQGQLAENVKWKVGGRVDADVVYMASDFYLD